MKLPFTKMQGLGNDFVVLDGVRQPLNLSSADYQRLADRHFGIGCDQILLVEPAQNPAADFRYRIFNADGSEVEQCGNGARCFVRFVHDQGLTDQTEIAVETAKGLIYPRLQADGQVQVNMGPPRFEPTDIPFVAEAAAISHTLDVGEQAYSFSVLSMGNPHAVLVVQDLDTAPVATLGPLVENHPRFPARVNVGFMQVLAPDHIRLRVFERGAGETLACGTGACAAVVAGIRRGLLGPQVRVQTRGGELHIAWAGQNEPVWMTGPAVTVFHGQLDWPD